MMLFYLLYAMYVYSYFFSMDLGHEKTTMLCLTSGLVSVTYPFDTRFPPKPNFHRPSLHRGLTLSLHQQIEEVRTAYAYSPLSTVMQYRVSV